MGKKYSYGEDYKVIAFVLACFPNDEQTRMMKAAVTECRKHNYKVVFFSTLTDFYYNDLNDAGEKKIFDAISVECYDAIVLMSESFKQDEEQTAMVQRAIEAGVPVFAVDKYIDGCINLAFDYGDTFREIVRHMIRDHGYRTVNFMGGMPGNSFSEERLNVFKEVLAEYDIPYDPRRTYYGYFWEEPTKVAMDKMFADGLSMPEAIICANDAMAIVVSNYLQDRGYRIPNDIAISGFDGMELEKYTRPRLTTGIYNENELMAVICDIIEKGVPKEYRDKVTPIYNKMQIGQSCGCQGVGVETLYGVSEMVRLRAEFDRQLRYQGDVNQLVANYGNAESFDDVIRVMPEYMAPLQYKDFWFCANTNLFDETDIGTNTPEGNYLSDNQNYTRTLNVLHYQNELDMPLADFNEQTALEELIPGLKSQLVTNDYLLVVTIHMRGKTAGYTVVSFDMKQFWFTAYAAFITNFRHLLEMQKSQKELMRVYMCDILTGLYNRNGFYQKIQKLFESAEGMDMTIISMDMDGLKKINDTYGHAEGDEALRALGEIIRKSVHHEIAARNGGDEFLIAFVGKDIEERTEEIVANIKEGIRQYNQANSKDYELHASIGAYTNRTRNHDLDHFLKKADDLMYARKYLHKKARGDI